MLYKSDQLISFCKFYMKTILILSLLLLLGSCHRILADNDEGKGSGSKTPKINLSFNYQALKNANAAQLIFSVQWNNSTVYAWSAEGVKKGQDPRRKVQYFQIGLNALEGNNSLKVNLGSGLILTNYYLSQKECCPSDNQDCQSEESESEQSNGAGKYPGLKGNPYTAFKLNQASMVNLPLVVQIAKGCFSSVKQLPQQNEKNFFTLSYDVAALFPNMYWNGVPDNLCLRVQWNGLIIADHTSFTDQIIHSEHQIQGVVGDNVLLFTAFALSTNQHWGVNIDNVKILSKQSTDIVTNGGFETNQGWTLTGLAIFMSTVYTNIYWPPDSGRQLQLRLSGDTGSQTIVLDQNYSKI